MFHIERNYFATFEKSSFFFENYRSFTTHNFFENYVFMPLHFLLSWVLKKITQNILIFLIDILIIDSNKVPAHIKSQKESTKIEKKSNLK